VPSDQPVSTAAPHSPHRLPRSVTPLAYRLTLAPDLEAATFSGEVEIDLEVLEPVTTIVCNAAELVIEEALISSGEGAAAPATVALDETAERVTFALPSAIGLGPARLRCRFTGRLNDQLRGFYRSTFTDEGGALRTIATTQMEATDARRAFPCWDEPDRKATFEVTLVVDEGLAAFSNSAVAEERAEGSGRRVVRFHPTMNMSTYLVAFVVGPLVATAPVDVDGVPLRVVCAPGKTELADFALEIAAHALRFFTSYFDITHPADKLDLLAIPDFAFGAMENLGCVTFRETALLVDRSRAARVELERVADVVAHEIAHMWFGDLVTMRWWEGIWLNEAFATFMEILCVDAFRPDWHRWVSFGEEREAALAVDGLHTTRPIEFPVGSPDEADAMFDVLTYQKGGGVLRMLEQYLGSDVFRDGVRTYLKAHAYGNTDTADLWSALEAASGEPVRSMMDSWILQGGHPLVSLEDSAITQRPFAYAPREEATDSAIGVRWQVPVILRDLQGGPARRLLLGTEPTALPDEVDPATAVLNAEGWGVYRVAYTAEHLGGLGSRLGALSALERRNLVADTWASVLAGEVALADFLALAGHLGDDDEPGTWGAVAGALWLCDRVVPEADRPAVADATRLLLGSRARSLGWDPAPEDTERTPTLRALLWSTLGTIGADPAAAEEADRRFAASPAAGGSTSIDADIESAVLGIVARRARPGDYEAMLARYRDPATPQEELRYLSALADFDDEALCRRTFDLALGEVRSQNAPYLVRALLENRTGGPAVWHLLVTNWSEVLERFPVNSHSRMLGGVRGLCGEPELAAQVEGFLTEHPIRSGQRTVEQTLERLGVNVAFGRRERPTLRARLMALDGARTS
jgi:puromycin-sensitive aminopeptidase